MPRAWMAGAAAVVVVSLLGALALWLLQARASKAAGAAISAVQAADARTEDAFSDPASPVSRLKAAPERSAALTTSTANTAKSPAASARSSVAATKSTSAPMRDIAANRVKAASTGDVGAGEARLKAAPTAAAATSGIAATSPDVGTPVAVTPPPASPSLEEQILAADRAWFNAFYRNDQASLTRLNAPGFALSDARAANRKAPAGSSPQRELRNVRVDVHGDGAVLSGRMIERITRGGGTEQHESFVSEVWIRRDGAWKLLGLRLASPEQVREAAGPLSAR
ncbi:MAG TPA: nuclear transport factor 2 family protein [Vicinamibacterales bacterium]|nr:nuclear transport factor 2 family protein [Vicinamibacterales bacterium]